MVVRFGLVCAALIAGCAPEIVAVAPNISCGNGRPEAGEECDDSGLVSGDGCSVGCNIESGWECEGSPSQCRLTCSNGFIDTGEGCDDTNTDNGDGCDNACQIEAGHKCAGAPSFCKLRCSDGLIDTGAGETCDDANRDSDDGCSNACEIEAGFKCTGAPSSCTLRCGDGLIDTGAGETCDDTNRDSDDGCDNACQIEAGYKCAGAPSSCTLRCGDGIIDTGAGETCDDGEGDIGDGCSNACRTEIGWVCSGEPSDCDFTCGNGELNYGEECDDDNTDSADGCSVSCTVEAGYQCSPAQPSVCTTNCGDGLVVGIEECDRAEQRTDEPCLGCCRTNCKVQTCGDSIVDLPDNEECDDAVAVDGDPCTPSCQRDPYWECLPASTLRDDCACVPGYSGPDCKTCRVYVSTTGAMNLDPTTWASALGRIVDATALLDTNRVDPSDHCEIWVEQGTYDLFGGGTINLPANTDLIGSFAGTENRPEDRLFGGVPTTVLDATGLYAGITLLGSTLIDGIELHGVDGRLSYQGGVIGSFDGDFTLRDSDIHDNQHRRGTAGVYVNARTVSIENCRFASNDSTQSGGGGLWVSATETVTVADCSFSTNEANRFGGGAYLVGTDITLTDNLFDGNSTDDDGGGLWANASASLTISGGAFTNNSGDHGGGAYLDGDELVINNITVADNNGYNGAGLFLVASVGATLTDLTVSSNISTGLWQGGGARVVGPTIISGGQWSSNSAQSGGGLFHAGPGSLTITGGEWEDNTAVERGGALVTFGDGVSLSSVSFRRNTVTGSSTKSIGGAVYVLPTTPAGGQATLAIAGSLFVDNSVTEAGTLGQPAFGGAVAIEHSGADLAVTVGGAQFVGNSASAQSGMVAGGALYCDGPGTIDVLGSLFASNAVRDGTTAGTHGGAARFTNGCNAAVSGSRFFTNLVDANVTITSGGGALSFELSTGTVESSIFAGNGGGRGGAIRLESSPLLVRLSLFAANVADDGSALMLDHGSDTTLVNITLADGVGDRVIRYRRQTDGPLAIANSLVQKTLNDLCRRTPVVNLNNTFCGGSCTDFVTAFDSSGLAWDTADYNPVTGTTEITASGGAAWDPGELVGVFVTVDPATAHRTAVVANSAASVTVWGNMESIVSTNDLFTFKDYHLVSTSTLIDTAVDPAMDILPEHTDIDGDPSTCVITPQQGYDCRDIGADEFVP